MTTTRMFSLFALGALAIGCSADGGQTPAPIEDAALTEYEREAIALKETNAHDYDAVLSPLQARHGIVTQEAASDTLAALPVKELSERAARPELQPRDAALVLDAQGIEVKRVHWEIVHLTAGETLSWSTSNGTEGVDPVLVLFQYDDAGFIESGYLPPSAMPKLSIKAYSDDYASLHPYVSYTAPSTGYYVMMLHAYSYATNGSVELFRSGCDAPPPPVCQGNICQQPPTPCFSAHDYSVPVRGYTVRGTDVHELYTEGSNSDPWLYAFEVSSSVGAANDDYSGVNSRIHRGDFALTSSSSKNCVLVSGYYDGGWTRLKGWYHF